MTRPWLHGELALAVGLSMLGEEWESIALSMGRPESDLADALVIVRDIQLYVRWSERIEALRRDARALRESNEAERREAKRLAEIPTPRVLEPQEQPARWVPRRFARTAYCPETPRNITAQFLGDPAPNRSALSQKKEQERGSRI